MPRRARSTTRMRRARNPNSRDANYGEGVGYISLLVRLEGRGIVIKSYRAIGYLIEKDVGSSKFKGQLELLDLF